jgi:hypothetical protein
MKREVIVTIVVVAFACDIESGDGPTLGSEDMYECEGHHWNELGQDQVRYNVNIGKAEAIMEGDWTGIFTNEEAGTNEIAIHFGGNTGEISYQIPVLTSTGRESGYVVSEEDWERCLAIDIRFQCQGEISGGELAREFGSECCLIIKGDGSLQESTENWLEKMLLESVGEVNDIDLYYLAYGEDSKLWMVKMEDWATWDYSCTEIGSKAE